MTYEPTEQEIEAAARAISPNAFVGMRSYYEGGRRVAREKARAALIAARCINGSDVIEALVAERDAANARIAKMEEALVLAGDFIQREHDLRQDGAFDESDEYIAEPARLCSAISAALAKDAL